MSRRNKKAEKALQRLAERAYERKGNRLRKRGRGYVHGPWWRHEMFDVIRLHHARESGHRCRVCGSEQITGCWGAMWCAKDSWGCARCLKRFCGLVNGEPYLSRYREIIREESAA